MHTESRAHLVYYSCICGKFMVVYSAVVSQADIVPLIQNFRNCNTENCCGRSPWISQQAGPAGCGYLDLAVIDLHKPLHKLAMQQIVVRLYLTVFITHSVPLPFIPFESGTTTWVLRCFIACVEQALFVLLTKAESKCRGGIFNFIVFLCTVRHN